ncbi:MAG: AMP-binding protein [Dehalococcoidia bacterium]
MDHVDRYSILEPDQVAVETPDRSVSYLDLAALVRSGSGALAGYGVSPGDRVAIVARNDLPTLVAMWAVPRMGGVVVPLDPDLPADELRARLNLVDASLVLWDDTEPTAGSNIHPANSLFTGAPAEPHPHAPSDLHSIFFTSGSDGERKGVRLTWGNHEASAEASGRRLPLGPDDRWLAVLPLFHLGGFAVTYRAFRVGGTVILEPSFDPKRVAAAENVSYLSLVPTMLRRLLAEEPAHGPSRATLLGGAPGPVSLIEAADAAGLNVARTYGLTEAASQVATARPGEGPGALPLDGAIVEAGSSSKDPAPITIEGPMISPGYWGEADRVGPHATGDIGYFDESGRLHVVGRAHGVIISGGENVHPAQVERVLADYPGVVGVAVFGAADEEWGERVEAVLAPLALQAQLDAVKQYAAERLAPSQVPKRWYVVDTIPVGSTGKIDRRSLTGLAEAEE